MVLSLRQDKHGDKAGRVLLLACLLLLGGAGLVEAQTEKKKERLDLKLSAPATTACAGKSIDLELVVKNISREDVRIIKEDLWNTYYYGEFQPKNRGGGMASSCSHCRGDFLTLYPGETFWTAHKFSLSGEFFDHPGKFDIAVTLDSVTSNRVEFELIDCGKES